jgi:hypothetical protein
MSLEQYAENRAGFRDKVMPTKRTVNCRLHRTPRYILKTI